jgi:membrane-associated phospholipid phosphatase
MPFPDNSVRQGASPGLPGTERAARPGLAWPLSAGALLILAGVIAWRDPALNRALFLAVNACGPAAPTLWSCLSVAGLGLSTWIFLTAFAQARPERVARLLWIIIVGGIVIHFIKHGMASPRPLVVLGEGAVNVIGEPLRTQSMPSGHSAMAGAMLGLMLAEGRRVLAPRAALLAGIGWLMLALGIALSRLAVSAHWPADALVGFGLGVAFAGLAPRAWPVGPMTRLLARPLGQRLMAAGLLACAFAIAATPQVLAALGLAHSKLERQFATGYPLAEPLQWALGLVALAGAVRWWRAAAAQAR